MLGATAVWFFTAKNCDMKDTDIMTDVTERLQMLDATLVQRSNMQFRLLKEGQQQQQQQLQRSGAAASAAQAAAQKSVYVVTTNRVPNRCFSVINDSCVEATGDLDAIVGKLKNMYTLRQTVQIVGHEYVLGDFLIRLGTISLAPSSSKRGVAVEIEYKPLVSLAVAYPVIFELFQSIATPSLLATAQRLDPVQSLKSFKLDPQYSHLHTICQHVVLLQSEEVL